MVCMISVFYERLQAAMSEASLSYYQLAKDLGESESNLYKYVRREQPFSDELLLKISEHPKLGLDFLDLKSWAIEAKTGKKIVTRALRGEALELAEQALQLLSSQSDPDLKGNQDLLKARSLASRLIEEFFQR